MASNFNPMKEDYNDKNFNSYVNQGFKVLPSMETHRNQLLSEAQSRTLELHVSRYFIENLSIRSVLLSFSTFYHVNANAHFLNFEKFQRLDGYMLYIS